MMLFKCQYETACKIHSCGTCVFNDRCGNCTHINDEELTECLDCDHSPISASAFAADSSDSSKEERKKRYLELIKEHDGRYGELLCEMMNSYNVIRLQDVTYAEVKKFYEDIVNGVVKP